MLALMRQVMISPKQQSIAVSCRRDPEAECQLWNVIDGAGLAIINKLLVPVLSCSSSDSDLSRGRLQLWLGSLWDPLSNAGSGEGGQNKRKEKQAIRQFTLDCP